MRNPKACVSDPNSFVTNPGSRMKEIFKAVVDDCGCVELVKDSEVDWQEYIESWRDQTDMAWILQQLQLGNGDVLNRAPMTYADFRNFPTTYAELLQLNINAKQTFENLPVSVKKEYGMDFNRWFADFGTENWLQLMNFDKPVDPVKLDESEVVGE